MSNDTTTPARPTIDFSLASRATARQYAANHISKANKPETNLILSDIVDGDHLVDAYDLNEALLDAMRGATTRAGQSPLRRVHGREIAYLGHIVQAVLESHADNLPAYAEGDRSRAVEDAKQALREAKDEVTNLTQALRECRAERSDLTQAASVERRRLCEEIDSHLALIKDLKAKAFTEAQSLYREINEQDAALSYAFTLLNDEQQSRLAGFRDGWQERANQG